MTVKGERWRMDFENPRAYRARTVRVIISNLYLSSFIFHPITNTPRLSKNTPWLLRNTPWVFFKTRWVLSANKKTAEEKRGWKIRYFWFDYRFFYNFLAKICIFLLQISFLFSIFAPRNLINYLTNIMELSIIILLSVTVLLLVVTIALLVRSHLRQDDELRRKNDVIVREVRRNQELIRSALLMIALMVLLPVALWASWLKY